MLPKLLGLGVHSADQRRDQCHPLVLGRNAAIVQVSSQQQVSPDSD